MLGNSCLFNEDIDFSVSPFCWMFMELLLHKHSSHGCSQILRFCFLNGTSLILLATLICLSKFSSACTWIHCHWILYCWKRDPAVPLYSSLSKLYRTNRLWSAFLWMSFMNQSINQDSETSVDPLKASCSKFVHLFISSLFIWCLVCQHPSV